MAVHRIAANSSIDVLNKGELHEVLGEHLAGMHSSYFQEVARGFTTARFYADGTVAAGAVAMPAPGQEWVGPNNGFAWAVQRVSAFNLATGDVLNIFRNDTSAANYIGSMTVNSPYHPGEKGFIMRSDERLIFVGSGLMATGDIVVNGEAVEVSELDLYKVLG